MAFTRGNNPIWFFNNLVGQPFDDTYYAFFLTNTLPYIPQAVYQDPNGVSAWNDPIEFSASAGLPNNLYFSPNLVYRIEFRNGPNQTDPLIWLVENYVPIGSISSGLAGQLAYFAANGTTISGGQLSNILGTATNDNSATGYVGEYVSDSVLQASAVSLTTATPANIAHIALTAGDWDVSASISFVSGGTTVSALMLAGISKTSTTFETDGANNNLIEIGGPGVTLPTGMSWTNCIGTYRASLAGSGTIYLVAQSSFATSTMIAYGYIAARRMR